VKFAFVAMMISSNAERLFSDCHMQTFATC